MLCFKPRAILNRTSILRCASCSYPTICAVRVKRRYTRSAAAEDDLTDISTFCCQASLTPADKETE